MREISCWVMPFSALFLLSSLLEKSVDAVFEQLGGRKRPTDFRKSKRFSEGDQLAELLKPKRKPGWMRQVQYDLSQDSLVIRELKMGGKVIITTLLLVKKTSKKQLKALYYDHRHVELDLHNIKTTLGMDSLSCMAPKMIEKEIWIYILAGNFI